MRCRVNPGQIKRQAGFVLRDIGLAAQGSVALQNNGRNCDDKVTGLGKFKDKRWLVNKWVDKEARLPEGKSHLFAFI